MIAPAGGTPDRITTPDATDFFGISWAADGRILFVPIPTWARNLLAVPATPGSESSSLIEIDASINELAQTEAQLLPDGRILCSGWDDNWFIAVADPGNQGYRSSYSHRGRYYTPDALTDFDDQGLWSCRAVWFSMHGSLLATADAFIGDAAAGYFTDELASVLYVGVKEVLLTLHRGGRIARERVAGRYLHLSSDPPVRPRQRTARTMALTQAPARWRDGLPAGAALTDEVRAALVLLVSLLDEQQRRLYAGLESLKHGHGGDRLVADLLGLDVATVARGRRELLNRDLALDRAGAPGRRGPPTGGKKTPNVIDVIDAIHALMQHETAGIPLLAGATREKREKQGERLLRPADGGQTGDVDPMSWFDPCWWVARSDSSQEEVMRNVLIAVAALAVPLVVGAQEGGNEAQGWETRLDGGSDATSVLHFRTMGSGVHASTAGSGAAIFWQPNSMGKGNFTISASFTQTEPSGHPNAYGLFWGGSDLSDPSQLPGPPQRS